MIDIWKWEDVGEVISPDIFSHVVEVLVLRRGSVGCQCHQALFNFRSSMIIGDGAQGSCVDDLRFET